MHNMNLCEKNFVEIWKIYFILLLYSINNYTNSAFFFQKNLLSAILPKGIVTKISRDFSLYTSNTFRELCSKCHDDVR